MLRPARNGLAMTALPAPRFLFRYRDLVADTIAEHRGVLGQLGRCWWGWWKRPNEPARLEVWEALASETVGGQRVPVALFHSGNGQVHLAAVDRVVQPTIDDLGEGVPVSPPADEQDAIPAYYRFSSYSRGWLRIVRISEAPTEFFGRYSYASPPPLPQHQESQLARLTGKRIIDADELRAMDTTIWEIKPSGDGDSSERFLAATPRLDGPLSTRPVVCSGDWLLHLTDPHFAVAPNRDEHRWRLEAEDGAVNPTMVDQIHESLRHHKRAVGAVLVTGDLTYVASQPEFEEARRGLFKLTTGLLGLGLEHLVVVPGNHDIAWSRDDVYDHNAVVSTAPAEATKQYRMFFERLYGFPASDHLSMARRFVFPGGKLVDVVGVNSSSLEQGRSFLAGMGRVQEAGYREAAGSLSWNSPGLGLRVLALHHHLALTEDLESPDEYRKGFGVAIDAPRVQRIAARDGVHLALHGHKHRAFVWRTGAYELPEYSHERWDVGSFNIVGGGSSGSTSTDGGRNFFNLIRLVDSAVELEMYRSRDGGIFERFTTWRASLTTSEANPGLSIGPWRAGPRR